MADRPVAVVGGGPAGLAAATELRRLGASEVVVIEREAEPGGIPRHARHQGFGLRDLRRPLSGPVYARRWVQLARDPEYGRIVCFCERVTRGEIRDALASPVPPVDLDGLRRRTRAHMGRCQGFFCGARLAAMLAEREAAARA